MAMFNSYFIVNYQRVHVEMRYTYYLMLISTWIPSKCPKSYFWNPCQTKQQQLMSSKCWSPGKKTEPWNRMDMNGKIWKVRKRSRKWAHLPLFWNLMLQYFSTFFGGLFLFQKHGCQKSPKLLYDTIFQGSFIWVNMVLVRPPGAQLLVLGAACGAVDT